MPTKLEPTNKSHRILVLTLTILLTTGVIGGGVYYVLNQQIKKQDKLIDELQKENVAKTETKTDTTKTETPAVKDETADWKIYKNDQYKFQVTVPESWKGYKVTQREKTEWTEAIYDFRLFSKEWNQDAMLIGIAVYTKEKFAEENDAAIKIGKGGYANDVIRGTSEYVYVAYYPQNGPADISLTGSSESIFDTFELIK